MGKTRAIKLYLNKTYDDKKFKTKAGVIKDGKDAVGYTPLCVFSENKPRKVFWRGARQLILFVEDALHALSFTEATEELQMAWGKSEAREFLYKLEALAVVSVKPIKTWQFFAIMLMLGIAIVIGVMNLQKLAGLGL